MVVDIVSAFRNMSTKPTMKWPAVSSSMLVPLVALHQTKDGSDGAMGEADRRGAQVAIMALARKLAHVLYALWKHSGEL